VGERWRGALRRRTAAKGGPYKSKRDPRAQSGVTVPQAEKPKNRSKDRPLQTQENPRTGYKIEGHPKF